MTLKIGRRRRDHSHQNSRYTSGKPASDKDYDEDEDDDDEENDKMFESKENKRTQKLLKECRNVVIKIRSIVINR